MHMSRTDILKQYRAVRGLPQTLVTICLGTLFAVGTAKGQVLIHSPDSSLACLEEWDCVGGVRASRCEGGAVSVETLTVRWNEFPSATIEAVLDGLEGPALTSESRRLRMTAAVYLTTPGSLTTRPTMPGIVARAARVYRSTTEYIIRYTIVSAMREQAERAQAIAFLKDVALEDAPQDRRSEWPIPFAAVTVLADMSAEGRAALEQLNASGEVRNPQARAFVQNISR